MRRRCISWAQRRFLGWLIVGGGFEQALTYAIAVLIITCPCALALAVPAVQVAATGRLFAKGVIVKAADGLERLSEVDTIVFDKTGTLTRGEPSLANADEIDDATLAAAASLAVASRHPYSRAVVRTARERGIAVAAAEGVIEQPGSGLLAPGPRGERRLGSTALGDGRGRGRRRRRCGIRDGDAAPIALRFEDALRSDAASVVATLRRAGYRVDLLSGDREASVRAAARDAGIAEWASEVRPDGKIARLEALKAEGRKVLMVGDGLNDAPALAAAHASLSPSTAADVSQTACRRRVPGRAAGADHRGAERGARQPTHGRPELRHRHRLQCRLRAACHVGLRHAADRRAGDVAVVHRGDRQRAALAQEQADAVAEANVMTSLAWLIPCALGLGALALGAFLWALNSGQFDDLEGAGWRAIQDDEDPGPGDTTRRP